MDLLTEIKKRLSITGDFHDSLLLGYADDVKQYMLSAGVKESVINSKMAIGCISRGVLDLWTKDTFSEIFRQRVIQLCLEPETELEPIPEVAPIEPGDNLEDIPNNEEIGEDNGEVNNGEGGNEDVQDSNGL